MYTFIDLKHSRQFIFNLGWSAFHMSYQKLGYVVSARFRGAHDFVKLVITTLCPKPPGLHRLADYIFDCSRFQAKWRGSINSPLYDDLDENISTTVYISENVWKPSHNTKTARTPYSGYRSLKKTAAWLFDSPFLLCPIPFDV